MALETRGEDEVEHAGPDAECRRAAQTEEVANADSKRSR
jgi:hypothetical protein